MKATDLRAYQWGDPAKAYELKESGTCKGCQHETKMIGLTYCELGRKYGRKCARYRERDIPSKV